MDNGWTFFSNHGHVLVCITDDPDTRLRDVAERVGITERAVQAIVNDLVDEGYVTRVRVGRRNRYEVHPDQPLRHAVEQGRRVGDVLSALDVGATVGGAVR